MGTIVEMFDEVEKKYVSEIIEFKDYCRFSDSDYKRIEAALIRYADDLRKVN